MTSPSAPSDEQVKLWNGTAGCGWVEMQGVLDALYKPIEAALLEGVPARAASQVLDVGCGTGGSTLAFARHLGNNSRCVGIDISEPMLAAARARAERHNVPMTFIQGDAQTYEFEPASFDMIISRFGVMFFSDSVQAFRNLHRAAKDAAQIRFIAWRSSEENPFMTTAEHAAAPLLKNIPPRPAEGPGQFAFADRSRVRRILKESGWTGIDIHPVDIPCVFPERELVRLLSQLGPVGRILQEADEETRSRVIAAVRPAFAPYVHGPEVRFTAACWMANARAPAR